MNCVLDLLQGLQMMGKEPTDMDVVEDPVLYIYISRIFMFHHP